MEELGLEPGAELQKLQAAVLAQYPTLDLTIAAPASPMVGRPNAALALRLASGFHEYLHQRSPTEAEQWLTTALQLPGAEAPTPQRAEALWRFAMSPAWLSAEADFAAAEAAARESLGLSDELHDSKARADSRMTLGALMYLQHRSEEAQEWIREAVSCARDAGDPVVLADTLNVHAVCAQTLEEALRSGDEPPSYTRRTATRRGTSR